VSYDASTDSVAVEDPRLGVRFPATVGAARRRPPRGRAVSLRPPLSLSHELCRSHARTPPHALLSRARPAGKDTIIRFDPAAPTPTGFGAVAADGGMEALIATLQLGALRLGPEVINGRAASARPYCCRGCVVRFAFCCTLLTRRFFPSASAVVGFLGVFLNEIATGRSIWGQFFGAGFFSAVGLMAAVSVASVAPLITGAVPAAKVFPSGASAARTPCVACVSCVAGTASVRLHRDGFVRERAPARDVDAHRGDAQRPRRQCAPCPACRSCAQLHRLRAPCQFARMHVVLSST
jgi:hypothetical protein